MDIAVGVRVKRGERHRKWLKRSLAMSWLGPGASTDKVMAAWRKDPRPLQAGATRAPRLNCLSGGIPNHATASLASPSLAHQLPWPHGKHGCLRTSP